MKGGGYFVETGDWPLVVFFAVVFVSTTTVALHPLWEAPLGEGHDSRISAGIDL